MRLLTAAAVLEFLLAACLPGQTVLLGEDFATASGTTPPPGWSTAAVPGTPPGSAWRFDNPGSRPIDPLLTAPVAITDSAFGGPGPSHTFLQSPPFDASQAGQVELRWKQWHQPQGSTVVVSVFDGSMVVPVYVDSAGTPPNDQRSVDITQVAAGVPGCFIVFECQSPSASWWMVDDVEVVDPTPTLDIEEYPPVLNCSGCPCEEQILGVSCGCASLGQGSDTDYSANRVSAGRSVLPHSGQEMMDETDLVLRGRDHATDIKLMRRHLTRITQAGSMFGPAWAFNYRHYFVQQPGGDIDMFSFGRRDVFSQQSPAVWTGGAGRFERLSHDGGSMTTLRMPGGSELLFHTETAGGRLVGHLVAIVSPNAGNRIIFTYETAGQQPILTDRRLLTITESFGRDIDFLYQDPAHPALVTTIRDFSGREVLYSYDAEGRLASVRSPTVTSTGGLNDFPAGKTRLYGYLGHADPRLANALTSVVHPNEAAAGQEPRLAWTYETDPTSPFFGFVATHTVGNPAAPGDLAAGGVYTYAYEAGPGGGGPNDVAMRTTIVDRRGTTTVVECNRLGQMLREDIVTAGLRAAEPASRARDFSYNADGDMTRSVDVLGTTSDRLHADPLTHPRTSQANEIMVMMPADARGGDQSTIVAETIYEPVFNRPFKVVDPRGQEPGHTPAQFTTTYVYDYMEDLASATTLFAPRLGLTTQELAALFTAAGITSVGDVNGDGVTSQHCGNLIRVVHPDVTLPPAAVRVGLTALQAADEIFRYNAFGQLTFHRDAEENVLTYEYFSARDPDGDGAIDVPNGDPATGGYLRRIVRDAQSGAGRNGGHDPSPVMKTTTFEYGTQMAGAFPANPRGVPTAITDARGIKRTLLVNELDQVVEEVRAADVSASPEAGLIAYAYERHTLYDANDNVVGVRIRNKDTLDGDDDFIVHAITRDILDQRKTETLDVGGLAIVNRWEYDASQNLVTYVKGAGSADESTSGWTYDERDLVVSWTDGMGTPEASAVVTEIDDNGNVTRVVDAVGGDAIQYVHDGFDRLRRTIDRNGNETIRTYDSSSNTVRVDRTGPADETSSTAVTLARTDVAYDERNRSFRTDQHVFHYAGKAVGTIDEGAASAGPGLVTSTMIRDRLGRIVGLVDADDDTLERRYDGISRLVRTIDPAGNVSVHTYDANDNPIAIEERETSPLVIQDEVFVTTFTYDSLDRLRTETEPNGQTTLFAYDSRDNVIRTTDALGNQIEHRHDRLDRAIDTRTYLSRSGRGASAATADAAQGGGDGVITLRQSFDALHRVRTRTDDGGHVTSYDYDDLDRMTSRRFADGTSESWSWNADDELVMHVTQNGSTETWTYDPGSRPTQVSVDNTGTSVIGTTLATWGYDGLDRVTVATDDNGAGEDVTCRYLYDSLSRVIRESQTVGSRPTLSVDSQWQGTRRRVSDTYPNGRVVWRGYDGLDRLTSISEAAGPSIAAFDYVGPRRTLRVTYGNGSVLDKRNDSLTQSHTGPGAGYDGNRRDVRHAWRAPGGDRIAEYVNTYDGPGGVGTNRRVSEHRLHLGRRDTYGFDSSYRMIRFTPSEPLPATSRQGIAPAPAFGLAVPSSTRVLDGTDRMTAFVEQGADRAPVVDGVPAEAGMNQYSSFDGSARTYDENANLAGDGRFSYLYDHRDRLVEVRDSTSGALVTRHVYAAGGRRVLRVAGPSTTRYLYSAWQVLEERDGTDTVLRQLVDGRGLDEHCQLIDFTQPGTPAYYYHDSSQGFVGALSDDTGAAVEFYEYSWLGRARILGSDKSTTLAVSAVGNPYMFQGRRFDRETGLYYYRHRYYDPGTGSFITIDPLGSWQHGQGNGYSAFGEDGWNNHDPLGLDGKKAAGKPKPHTVPVKGVAGVSKIELDIKVGKPGKIEQKKVGGETFWTTNAPVRYSMKFFGEKGEKLKSGALVTMFGKCTKATIDLYQEKRGITSFGDQKDNTPLKADEFTPDKLGDATKPMRSFKLIETSAFNGARSAAGRSKQFDAPGPYWPLTGRGKAPPDGNFIVEFRTRFVLTIHQKDCPDVSIPLGSVTWSVQLEFSGGRVTKKAVGGPAKGDGAITAGTDFESAPKWSAP